jgi:hypothetical protein
MKVVIDIPDKNKRDIYWVKGKRAANLVGEYKAVAVLPEGHGRLIDADAVIDNGISKGFCDWYDEIKYAPTVIEAEKDGDNE